MGQWNAVASASMASTLKLSPSGAPVVDPVGRSQKTMKMRKSLHSHHPSYGGIRRKRSRSTNAPSQLRGVRGVRNGGVNRKKLYNNDQGKPSRRSNWQALNYWHDSTALRSRANSLYLPVTISCQHWCLSRIETSTMSPPSDGSGAARTVNGR